MLCHFSLLPRCGLAEGSIGQEAGRHSRMQGLLWKGSARQQERAKGVLRCHPCAAEPSLTLPILRVPEVPPYCVLSLAWCTPVPLRKVSQRGALACAWGLLRAPSSCLWGGLCSGCPGFWVASWWEAVCGEHFYGVWDLPVTVCTCESMVAVTNASGKECCNCVFLK